MKIERITAANQAALQLPNEPFSRFGEFIVTRDDQGWHHHERLLTKPFTQTFPDEHYQLADIDAVGFALGAFDEATCICLATFEYEFRWNHYLYLADLKVNQAYRGQGIGHQLLNAAIPLAEAHGNQGLCTIAQGSNLAANRFYLKYGFHIGGLNTADYHFTSARGETDINYYLEF